MIERVASAITRIICIFIFAASTAILVYWFTDPNRLAPFLLIKFNTAFSLFLSGISLWCLRKGPNRTGYFSAALVAMIGTLTLLQYIFEINFGIDQIFVSDIVNQESLLYPGRMSPIAALCLALVGNALLMIDVKITKKGYHFASFFLIPVLLLSFLAIVGYAYGVTSFYTVGPYIRIALPTTILLGAISVGIICARPFSGPFSIFFSAGIGGMMARRFLPPVTVLPVVLGWLRLEGQRLGYLDLYMGVAVLVVTFTVLFCFIIGFQGQNLNTLDVEREKTRLRFESIFEKSPTAFALVRASDRKIVDVNASWVAQFGYSKEEIIGKTSAEIGWYQNPEDRIFTQSGASRIISNNMSLIEIDGEKYILGALQDVTELRESEEKFRQLADSMPQIVWTADANGRMEYANERWYEFTGFDRNIDIDDMREKIFHADDLNRFRSVWSRAVKTGQPYQAEYRFKNKMGAFRWFLSRALPVKNAQGRVIRWFGTSTDIDIQKKNEIDLAEAIFSRDEFISIASHELKTPITSLKLQLQMLQRSIDVENNKVPPAEKLAKSLEITNRQSRRLEGLVEELLDVTRARSGKLKFHFEDFDLSELIVEIAERLRHQLHEAKIELRLDLVPHTVGQWDRSRLDQVIVNLIINSIKYAPGKPVTIKTGTLEETAFFSIKDEGPGIPKEKQHLIFLRFERVTNSESVAGLGLGLFLVKQIVDGHRGEIRVESELEKGTLFTVSLPLKTQD